MNLATPICNGVITTQDGVALCSVDWSAVPYQQPFDISQLDLVIAGQAFGAGFTIIMTFSLLGIGITAILNMLKNG